MTKEREQYLAGISEEERLAREAIQKYKREIARINKNSGLFSHFLTTKDIIDRKKTISLLKKYLPMKVINQEDSYYASYGECPICHRTVNTEYDEEMCIVCGQSLRWDE